MVETRLLSIVITLGLFWGLGISLRREDSCFSSLFSLVSRLLNAGVSNLKDFSFEELQRVTFYSIEEPWLDEDI